MKRTLIGFGLAGMLLFALAWLLSFAQPQLVAAGLNQANALQVERQIGQHAAALPHPEQAQRAESATKAAARTVSTLAASLSCTAGGAIRRHAS